MKNGFVIFLAAFTVLLASWSAFVLGPQLQLGGAKQVPVLNSTEVYPHSRPGEANQGLQVYRANGCAACHTMQVQQDGVVFEIMLTSFGKNKEAVLKAFDDSLQSPDVIKSLSAQITGELKNSLSFKKGEWPGNLPSKILGGLDKEAADVVSDKITAAGGKVETRIVAVGPDIARGWGLRHSVAEDFLYDNPVQLGSLRIGPDLANVGARSEVNTILLHLYAPKSVVQDSLMPPFRYLFETRKIGDAPSPDALNLPKEFAPAAGCEVVPKPEARQLAAYLLSLHADVPLYDAPFTPIAAKP